MNAKIWDVKTQNMITAELKMENALGKHYQDNEGNWYNVVDNNCTEKQIQTILDLDEAGSNYAFNKMTVSAANELISNLQKLQPTIKLAKKYGKSVSEIQFQFAQFIDNEGFFDNGFEAKNFGQWCAYAFRFENPMDAKEPWQKGDLNQF